MRRGMSLDLTVSTLAVCPTLTIVSHVFLFQSVSISSDSHPNLISDVIADACLVPRFLQRYASGLKDAPISHISAFLVVHEITAIVPIIGFAGLFHYTNWLPPYISEWEWVSDGMIKFGNYFRRKGWLGKAEANEIAESEIEERPRRERWWQGKNRPTETTRQVWWRRGEGGARIVAEVATAYAITKALLPLRLGLSVWAAPWFARTFIVPGMNGLKRVFRMGASRAGPVETAVKTAQPAAGTGATAGGVFGPRPLQKR